MARQDEEYDYEEVEEKDEGEEDEDKDNKEYDEETKKTLKKNVDEILRASMDFLSGMSFVKQVKINLILDDGTKVTRTK